MKRTGLNGQDISNKTPVRFLTNEEGALDLFVIREEEDALDRHARVLELREALKDHGVDYIGERVFARVFDVHSPLVDALGSENYEKWLNEELAASVEIDDEYLGVSGTRGCSCFLIVETDSARLEVVLKHGDKYTLALETY